MAQPLSSPNYQISNAFFATAFGFPFSAKVRMPCSAAWAPTRLTSTAQGDVACAVFDLVFAPHARENPCLFVLRSRLFNRTTFLLPRRLHLLRQFVECGKGWRAGGRLVEFKPPRTVVATCSLWTVWQLPLRRIAAAAAATAAAATAHARHTDAHCFAKVSAPCCLGPVRSIPYMLCDLRVGRCLVVQ